MTTPTKIEPWMIEAAKELFTLYRTRPFDPVYWHIHRWNESALSAIIARHAAPGAKTQEDRHQRAVRHSMSLEGQEIPSCSLTAAPAAGDNKGGQ